ncbi:hypothetical protein ACFL27_24270 [candidate division CSSED10-310 bacterium]|uniref:Phosphatidate cytidylyltransferase n=1 Tax=candidate division CSSED10-310 bacterium TaxID=2855610 RepID=A0ABV6Z4F7_UNCC1
MFCSILKDDHIMLLIADRLLSFFVENFPSLEMMIIYGPLGLGWAYLCLFFAGYLKQKKALKTGYTRKIFHILIFMSVVLLQIVRGTAHVCLFGGLTTVVIFYAVFRGEGHLLYEAIARETDAPQRTNFIIIPYFATLFGGITSNILFGQAAIIGYLVTGLGDAVGEPVGTRFGKHTYRVLSFRGVPCVRSYEGSLAVLLVSIIAISLGIVGSQALVFTSTSIITIPVLGGLCMLIEAFSPHGWDNATMQILPSGVACLFM